MFLEGGRSARDWAERQIHLESRTRDAGWGSTFNVQIEARAKAKARLLPYRHPSQTPESFWAEWDWNRGTAVWARPGVAHPLRSIWVARRRRDQGFQDDGLCEQQCYISWPTSSRHRSPWPPPPVSALGTWRTGGWSTPIVVPNCVVLPCQHEPQTQHPLVMIARMRMTILNQCVFIQSRL